MIALAVEALVASGVLMLVVLVLRSPVRCAFGPQVAYLLWLLPVLRLVLPPLPPGWTAGATAPIAGVGGQTMGLIAPLLSTAMRSNVAVPPVVADGITSGVVAAWLAAIWLAGVLAMLASQLVQYRRFSARVLRGARPLDRVGSIAVVESAGASGPLAFGLWRQVVAFPRDFAARYDPQERALALAHEVGHHRRGDLWANWIALGVLALHWFNPVAWFAFRAFRADQEMANDAGVLAQAGMGLRHAYGCAIVKAAHGRALTPASHLNTVNDLKGRLRMLARGGVSRRRLAAGGGAIVLLAGAGLVSTASGMPAAAHMRDRVEQATGLKLDTFDRTFEEAVRPVARERTTRRVTIVENGRTTVLSDAAAANYIAAHPAPLTPVPPTPPLPPRVGGPAGDVRSPAPPGPPTVPGPTGVDRGEMSEDARAALVEARADRREAMRDAEDARREAMQEAQEARREASRESVEGRRDALLAGRAAQREAQRAREAAFRDVRASLRSTLSGLATTRASLATNRDLSASDRAGALREVDDAVARVKAKMADID